MVGNQNDRAEVGSLALWITSPTIRAIRKYMEVKKMENMEEKTLLEILEYISEREKECLEKYGEIPFDIYNDESHKFAVKKELDELRDRVGLPWVVDFDELRSDVKKLKGMQKAIDDLKKHEHGKQGKPVRKIK